MQAASTRGSLTIGEHNGKQEPSCPGAQTQTQIFPPLICPQPNQKLFCQITSPFRQYLNHLVIELHKQRKWQRQTYTTTRTRPIQCTSKKSEKTPRRTARNLWFYVAKHVDLSSQPIQWGLCPKSWWTRCWLAPTVGFGNYAGSNSWWGQCDNQLPTASLPLEALSTA